MVELEGNRVAIVVADVAGKGLSAALLTAVLQGPFARITLTSDPIRLISQLNKYVWPRSGLNRYATAIMGAFGEDGSVECINAGHDSGLLARQGKAHDVFESECFPIGMFPDAEFCTSTAKLDIGDTLILFSDGLTKAARIDREGFGMERVSQAFVASVDLSGAILDVISEFTKAADQADYTTLLILRYKGIT